MRLVRVLGEQAPAGRAPRGRRCHAWEYGPRRGAGPPGRDTFAHTPGRIADAPKFSFNLVATNGQVIASSEAYESKASAINGIESAKRTRSGREVGGITTILEGAMAARARGQDGGMVAC